MKLEPVIGLEIHVQLKTKSKMFCGCINGEEGAPNTAICPICTGQPGALPHANAQAVQWGVKTALTLNCAILNHSKFDRKNYFYPDLPKGYQISQYDQPVGVNGFLEIEIDAPKNERPPYAYGYGEARRQAKIGITRLHLEEDAAKLVHAQDGSASLVDFNRAGAPLMEIVTEPDLRSPREAKIFLQELRTICRYLGVSAADMEKGQLRADANISLRPVVDNPKKEKTAPPQLWPKTEIKNINSFRAVERALAYEIERQKKLWEKEAPPESQSTRGWDDVRGVTVEQRTKEEAHDYRYFPEPDLPLLELTQIAEAARKLVPELPAQKRKRFIEQYDLSKSEAALIAEEPTLANFVERVISELKAWLLSLEEVEGAEQEIWAKHKKKLVKLVSGWLLSKLAGVMAEEKIDWPRLKITPENFAEFITLLYQNKISGPIGLAVLKEMMEAGGDPSQIVEEKKLEQVSDEKDIGATVKKVVNANPEPVADFKAGKTNALQFLVGQVMKATRGKANPEVVRRLLEEKLKKM